jgi:hypothetical protein
MWTFVPKIKFKHANHYYLLEMFWANTSLADGNDLHVQIISHYFSATR